MGLNGVVLGYPTSTNILQVDGLSTDPREMGRHRINQVGEDPYLPELVETPQIGAHAQLLLWGANLFLASPGNLERSWTLSLSNL